MRHLPKQSWSSTYHIWSEPVPMILRIKILVYLQMGGVKRMMPIWRQACGLSLRCRWYILDWHSSLLFTFYKAQKYKDFLKRQNVWRIFSSVFCFLGNCVLGWASHVTWDFSRFSIPTPQSRHSLSLSTLKFRGSTFDIPSIYLRCTFAFCFRGSIGTYKWHPTRHLL